ncbi:hypothetical protein LTR84_000346 [Exophiala bonariae]|uniref:Uncharacterized protein n=1 Tax=Exophiala bonariae TaxID=1690606 RepID=A0AAV9NQM7_9EURO|nr:hypothetical protein LTR84_000346 [Exophiala bonariae]
MMEGAIVEERRKDRPFYNAKQLADKDLDLLLDHVKAEKAWRDLARENQAWKDKTPPAPPSELPT